VRSSEFLLFELTALKHTAIKFSILSRLCSLLIIICTIDGSKCTCSGSACECVARTRVCSNASRAQQYIFSLSCIHYTFILHYFFLHRHGHMPLTILKTSKQIYFIHFFIDIKCNALSIIHTLLLHLSIILIS